MTAHAPQDTVMEYRRLGQTSLDVSIIGFGASPLGNVFGQTDPAESTAAVRYAIQRGINFFDVSPYYGLTVAETRLGEALEGHRADIVLATKCGRYGAGEFDFSEKRVTEEFEDSLRRLRTDHVDLLQAHDVEFADVEQIISETLPAMRRLQEQGKARYIGITGYSLRNLIEIAKRSDVDSMLTYCRYNLMNAEIDDALIPFAQENGIGIINASPLHMGILTRHGAPDWHPAPAEVKFAGRRVVEFCEARGVDVSTVALRFSLEHFGVASTFIGMSTRQHVDDNLRALQYVIEPALLAEVREIIGPVHNQIWPSGRDENHD